MIPLSTPISTHSNTTPSSDNTNTTSPSILAIDVGYGNVKAVWSDPKRPGGKWREISFRSVSPKVSKLVSVDGFGTSDRTVVTVADEKFAVGPHADRLTGGQLKLDPNYIDTPEYEALIRGVWHYFMRDSGFPEASVDMLVLGLPVSDFSQRRARLKEIGSQVRQVPVPNDLLSSGLDPRVLNVNAKQVMILPQPLGALMLAMEDSEQGEDIAEEGSLTMVIDPGYSTFDWLVTDGVMPRMDISGAFTGGVSRLMRAVMRKVSHEHGISAPELPRIEAAMAEGFLNTGVKKIDMAPYVKVMEDEADLVITGWLQRFVPGELGIKNILLTGGGAKYYQTALQKRLPEYNIRTMPDSMMSNARGFWLAGRGLLTE